MSYSDDFATVDTAGAPLDPTIMIGADPMFWGAILLGLVAAALVGWLIGQPARARRADAAHAIWDAVNDAAKAAMKADTEALPARASELQRVLKARLGKTLAFGGDLGKRARALDAALKGEVDEAGHAHAGHPPGPDAGHGHGEPGHGAAPRRTRGCARSVASLGPGPMNDDTTTTDGSTVTTDSTRMPSSVLKAGSALSVTIWVMP